MIALLLLAAALAAADSTVVRGPLAQRADSVLRAAEARGFHGVALIAGTDGTVILRKGYGFADIAGKVRMDAASVVQIGSVTKQITAAAILQLAERGKLGLDDPIAKHFANVPSDKQAITIRHLLKHESGLDDYLGGDYEATDRAEMLKRAMAMKMFFAPGEKQQYSNAGYGLLAAIVEQTSGMPLERYFRQHIFQPLGLEQIGLVLPAWDRRRIAHEYRRGEDLKTMLDRPHAADGSHWNLRGAGGIISTVGDLHRFYHALLTTDRLMTPATRSAMWSPDRPMIAAGSDDVALFLYDHEPAAGLDIVVASTSADAKANVVLEELHKVLGIQGPGFRRPVAGGGPAGGAAPSGAPVALPDTPAGRAAAEYLRAYAAGPDAMRTLFQDRFVPNPERTVEQRLAFHSQVREGMGQVTPAAIVESSPTRLTLQMRSNRESAKILFMFTVEPTAPHRLVSVAVEVE